MGGDELRAATAPAAAAEPHLGRALWRRASGVDRAVAVGVVLLCVASAGDLTTSYWAPKAAVLAVLGAAGLPALVARAAGRGRRQVGTRTVWAARFAVVFVAVAAVAAAQAARPWFSWGGQYQQGNGWLLLVALAGVWALGTFLSPSGRRLLGRAVVFGAVVNAVAALAEVITGGVGWLGLSLYQHLAPALQGNPVFFGGLMAAALALLGVEADRGERSQRLWTVLCAVGLGLAGVRMPLLVVGAVVVVVLWRAGRRRGGWPAWAPAVLFSAQAIGGIAAGSLLLLERSGGSRRLVSSTAQGTFGDRLQAWRAGLLALEHHPLLGYGPGQFVTATARYFPVWFDRHAAGTVFTDGHNLFVDVAVGTGALGLVLAVAWMALSLRRHGGPLLVLVPALLATACIEPMQVLITPLLFLALGAVAGNRQTAARAVAAGSDDSLAALAAVLRRLSEAGPARRRRLRPLTAATAVAVAVGAAAGVVLVTGDVFYQRSINLLYAGNEPAAHQAGRRADTLLALWPNPAAQLGTDALLAPGIVSRGHGIRLNLAGPAGATTPASGGVEAAAGAPRAAPAPQPASPLRQAVSWQRAAVRRDPTDFELLTGLAGLQIRAGEDGAAAASARRALAVDPWWGPALQAMATISHLRGDQAAANHWFALERQVSPAATAPWAPPAPGAPPTLGPR